MGDAAVDGVAEARLGLVADGDDGVEALVRRDLEQQLGDVAGAEHLVHVGELLRLLRREVGREHAPRQALAPQELARRARRPGTRRRRPRRRHRGEGGVVACARRGCHFRGATKLLPAKIEKRGRIVSFFPKKQIAHMHLLLLVLGLGFSRLRIVLVRQEKEKIRVLELKEF